MIILYNILQLTALSILWPFLLLFCLLKPKYRTKFGGQTGFTNSFPPERKAEYPRIWIHALSVGEVTSALPLVREIRRQLPQVEICFSANTSSGRKIAHDLLDGLVDYFLYSPIDIYPVVFYFQRKIKPDIYIQVETDFWPNQLIELKRRNIPSILVNGRISSKSFDNYKRFSIFFSPIFKSFHTLCMQTENDRQNMIQLGVNADTILTLGNLKYDVKIENRDRIAFPFIDQQPKPQVLVAGSTHDGEEEVIFSVYSELIKQHPSLKLILAPRNIERSADISAIASRYHLETTLRTEGIPTSKSILILDTLGELTAHYTFANIVFVGGSLAPLGGHNPIEPACIGGVTLFGPHMEDFSEISQELLNAGGAFQVKNEVELKGQIQTLLEDNALLQHVSDNAKQFIKTQQGVVDNHIQLIRKLV